MPCLQYESQSPVLKRRWDDHNHWRPPPQLSSVWLGRPWQLDDNKIWMSYLQHESHSPVVPRYQCQLLFLVFQWQFGLWWWSASRIFSWVHTPVHYSPKRILSDRRIIVEWPYTSISDYKRKHNTSVSDRTKLSDNQIHIHIKIKITLGQVISHSVVTPNSFDNYQLTDHTKLPCHDFQFFNYDLNYTHPGVYFTSNTFFVSYMNRRYVRQAIKPSTASDTSVSSSTSDCFIIKSRDLFRTT